MNTPQARLVYMPNTKATPPQGPASVGPSDWQSYFENPETQELIVRDICRSLGLEETPGPQAA